MDLPAVRYSGRLADSLNTLSDTNSFSVLDDSSSVEEPEDIQPMEAPSKTKTKMQPRFTSTTKTKSNQPSSQQRNRPTKTNSFKKNTRKKH